jgi:ferritin-like metal-binding protein YciE
MAKATRRLNDLFRDRLKDIYLSEKTILAALPKMAKAADSESLVAAFDKLAAETEEQITRLERVFELIDQAPRGKNCPAMIGIVEEARDIMEKYKDSPALDAGLLSAAQAVEHYEIARYGTLIVWAQQLGMTEAATILTRTLQEKVKTHLLLKLAEKASSRETQTA